MALGSISGQQGGSTQSGVTPNNFIGQVASLRIYDEVTNGATLSDTQLADNYLSTLNADSWVSAISGSTSAGIADPDGGAPTSASVTGTAGGLFTVSSDGSYTYNPNGVTSGLFDYLQAGDTATDTITYTVTTPTGQTDTATVTVTITGVNDAPTAANGAINVDVDATDTNLGIVPPFAAPNSFDPDNTDSSLTITVTQLPSEGAESRPP